MFRNVRKPLIVVLCVLTLLVGSVALARPAHAASGGGCSLQNIPVRACISIDEAGYVVADFYRDSWPSNCYQINIVLAFPYHRSPPMLFGCNTYHGIWNAGNQSSAVCIQNITTMYYSDGNYPTEVRSPGVCY